MPRIGSPSSWTADVYLATSLLTDAERAEAFETVSARESLLRGSGFIGSLIKNGGAELAELATGPGYVRFGLVALFDGLRLANRACAQTMESKSADLLLARTTPRTYLDEPQPTEAEAVSLLRRALIEMPLQEAAMLIDAALGHLGNAVVRLAVEANCASSAEMQSFELSGDPAKDKDWMPPVGVIFSRIQTASKAGMAAQLPFFRLVRRWQICMENADVQWVLKYRHGIVHRDVPVTGWPGGPTRAGAGGVRRLKFPMAVVADPRALDEVRDHIAAALTPIGDLATESEKFVTLWLRTLGFTVVDDVTTVSLGATFPRGMQNVEIEEGYVVVDIDPAAPPAAAPREKRDPSPFIEA
jgi:hypothetical protein